jgi:hypothetical protein
MGAAEEKIERIDHVSGGGLITPCDANLRGELRCGAVFVRFNCG